MAYIFNIKQCATLKGKSGTGDSLSIPGVTTANITPQQAATQVNKILAIGGKTILADETMSRVQTEEVISDGE